MSERTQRGGVGFGGSVCPKRTSAGRHDSDLWRLWLPVEWIDMVVVPLEIVAHHEYEIDAHRCLGYDEDHRQCFYAHNYRLEQCRSDDDEEFYAAIAYAEQVRAWRLRDDRWLVFRVSYAEDGCASNRGFYSFSDRPPR